MLLRVRIEAEPILIITATAIIQFVLQKLLIEIGNFHGGLWRLFERSGPNSRFVLLLRELLLHKRELLLLMVLIGGVLVLLYGGCRDRPRHLNELLAGVDLDRLVVDLCFLLLGHEGVLTLEHVHLQTWFCLNKMVCLSLRN